jgi:CRP-like cAMP-binding protein
MSENAKRTNNWHSKTEPCQNLLLAGLPPADLELLRPNLQSIELPSGLILIRSGDVPKRAYFPHSGIIASCITLSAGYVFEVRITGRDGALGAEQGTGERPSFTSAVVRLEGEASTIDYRSLQIALDKSAALRASVARYAALQQAMSDQSVACNATHVVQPRLARCLLRLYNISGQTKFALTQEVLAEMLGIRRNAISHVANAMKKSNLIHYSRGVVEIVDFNGLQRLACECYHTVTAYRDNLLEAQLG